MYRFEMCRCFRGVRCILMVCNSVFCVVRCVGMFSGVKAMCLCMKVSRPPPCLCVLSVLCAV